jgi:hypothetical protein
VVTKSCILGNLRSINRLYNSSLSDKKLALLYSKMAILETCGWIEETMDDIVLRCAHRLRIDSSDLKTFENDTVKRTWSFDYERNFRFMLTQLIGLRNVEKFEANVDKNKFVLFVSAIGTLLKSRNQVAHTHIKGVTLHLDAPSRTISYYQNVFDGLVDIDKTLRKLRL